MNIIGKCGDELPERDGCAHVVARGQALHGALEGDPGVLKAELLQERIHEKLVRLVAALDGLGEYVAASVSKRLAEGVGDGST